MDVACHSTSLPVESNSISLDPEVKDRWAPEVTEQSFGAHLLGTCRMGEDPSASVIDPDHRAHDVPNLFLCHGSSLVTGGRGQPTMTIQALAFRAADRIGGSSTSPPRPRPTTTAGGTV